MIKYTFFTPTYNRAGLLPRVYESILKIKRNDFEWIIVDDGSNDDTKEIVEKWINNSNLNIRYFYQENAGKHAAYNLMVQNAGGEFVFTIDSDDWVHEKIIDRFECAWSKIPVNEQYSLVGVVGLFANPDGTILGDSFPNEGVPISSLDINEKYRIKGDKYGVNKLSILKEFPFPTNLGQFVSEGIVWNDIALKYKQVPVNEVFAFKEYQVNGLTDRILQNRIKSMGATLAFYEKLLSAKRKIPFRFLLKYTLNYNRFLFHSKKGGNVTNKSQFSFKRRVLSVFLTPLSYLIYLHDRKLLSTIKS